MTDTAIAPVVSPSSTTHDDELTHIVCCVNKRVGICGAKPLTGPALPGDLDCVVCEDLDDTPHCPILGTCSGWR